MRKLELWHIRTGRNIGEGTPWMVGTLVGIGFFYGTRVRYDIMRDLWEVSIPCLETSWFCPKRNWDVPDILMYRAPIANHLPAWSVLRSGLRLRWPQHLICEIYIYIYRYMYIPSHDRFTKWGVHKGNEQI
jgi:hypothetical protein